MSTLYLCGAGNMEGIRLAVTVNRKHQRWQQILILDDDPDKLGKQIMGLQIVGPFSRLAEAEPDSQVVNLVTRSTRGRMKAREKIKSYGLPFAPLIHPNVDTFGTILPEDDITVYEYATLSAMCRVGEGTVVLGGAVTGHGSVIGRGCVLAPGAVVNARVKMGDLAYVGSNATVLPDLTIGESAVISAGSAVIEDVPANTTVIGIPAETLGSRSYSPKAEEISGKLDSKTVAEISNIWKSLLGLPEVSPESSFFDQGGTSILAHLLVERLHEEMGLRLTLVDVFRFPTVHAQARHLAAQGGEAGFNDAFQRAAKRRKSRQRISSLARN